MPESDYVFENGSAITVGRHGETEYAFSNGSEIPNTGKSSFVFENGIGIGGVEFIQYDASANGVLLNNGEEVNDGSDIDEWVDSQGIVNITGGSPNRRDGGLDGKTVVNYDGANGTDYLDASPDKVSFEQPFTVFAIPVTIEDRNIYAEYYISSHPDGNDNVELRYANTPESFSLDDSGNKLESSTSAETPILLSGVVDDDKSVLRENGTEVASGTLTENLDGVRIGNNVNGDRSCGDLAEVRIYRENLIAEGTMEDIESDLMDKWGL